MTKDVKNNIAVKAENILSFIESPENNIPVEDKEVLEKVSSIAQTIVLNFDEASEKEVANVLSLLSIVDKYFSYSDRLMQKYCIETLGTEVRSIDNEIKNRYYI